MDWINTSNCFALIIVNFTNIITSHYTNQALYKWERFHNWIGLQTVSAYLIKIVYHVDYKTNYIENMLIDSVMHWNNLKHLQFSKNIASRWHTLLYMDSLCNTAKYTYTYIPKTSSSCKHSFTKKDIWLHYFQLLHISIQHKAF